MNTTMLPPWPLRLQGDAAPGAGETGCVGPGGHATARSATAAHAPFAGGPGPGPAGAAAQVPARAPGLVPALVTLHQPDGAAAEGFRTLRSQLALRLGALGRPQGALAVISTERGDGRSWCAANLAVSMAQREGPQAPVLLVDANLRQPSLHAWMGLPGDRGLATALEGQAGAFDGVLPVAQVPGLFLLPAGTPRTHPLALLERSAFAQLLQVLGQRFPQIVVDTPAAAAGADAAVIAAHCQAALLVVRAHATAVQSVRALCEAFAPRGTPVAGVMLNGH